MLTVTTTDASGLQTVLEFSSEDLLSMQPIEVQTDNDFVEGETVFTGPLLRDLFGEISLEPDDEIVVTALNDYSTVIPASEALEYDVIVAVLMDGEEMSVRDKGPFWVIYPMSDHPELQDPGYNDRLIWQLSDVELTKD
ncbi:molybdopterin-dependent oxidoreductase [Pseudoruegeria sp. HB172150]|uniref:molybdopterin-dependent oxidoreductase n=1 Tax=Pseudoruegeria sp. HB172150 TaxID=2721164 RepID=UPI0020A66088|nr:molybdopterin-dependent oxidoreductase [Pseudoruegeria sp. HB172150]